MKTTTLSLELATKMYKGTDEQLRAFALENYPELGMSILDRVKSFEDACKVKGISTDLPDVSNLPEWLRQQVIVDYKLLVIASAINEEWEPNWDDNTEYKYYPWFKLSSSGVGFSCDDYVCVYSLALVGSRLVFPTSEKAKYFANQFLDLHRESRLIQK